MRTACGFLLALVTAAAAGGDYFPAGSLGDTPKEHQLGADRYSKHLVALREPSLWQISLQKPTVEVYRFLWLRTFHHPISVRLTAASDGTGMLSCKETNGQGGYEPGKLIRSATARLSKDQMRWFHDRLVSIGFWKLPTRQRLEDGTIILDGAQWIMEASKDGHYHIVDRSSPPPGDPIHLVGTMLMIDLARLRLLYQDVY